MTNLNIKVCGLTRPENIQRIAEIEVDYLGLIFYERSSRYAKSDELRAWLATNRTLLGRASKVGVFVNAGVDTILNTVHDYELDFVQLHGEESPGYCRELNLLWSVNTLRGAKIAKAFSITPDFDFAATEAYSSSCELFVFDTGGQAQVGGTGRQWDWRILDRYHGSTPFLLSGGIGPDDAAAVTNIEHPALAGVDINSRFETEPGVKDVGLLKTFAGEIRRHRHATFD